MNPLISSQNANRLTKLAQIRCGFINCLLWSPDGRTLAVAHGAGVWLWDEGFGGAPTRRLEEHTAPVKGVAFSPDSRVIASASADTTVRLWNSATGQALGVLRQHSDAVNAVAFSGNGRLLASGGGDGRVLLTDLLDSAGSTVLSGHSGEITSLAFGGAVLASGGWDKTLRLWDYAECRERAVITLDDRIRDLATSPDEKTLAVACKDGTVRLIDFASGDVIRTIQAHDRGADCAAFSPDGSLLATGGRDGVAAREDDQMVRLWDLQTPSDQPLVVLGDQRKPVLTVAFHPAGNLIASGSGDNTLRLWGVVID